MVKICKICQASSETGMFGLPLAANRRFEWCLRLSLNAKVADQNPRRWWICSVHFKPEDINRSTKRPMLSTDALPITNLSSEQLEQNRATWKRRYTGRDRLLSAAVQAVEGTVAHVAQREADTVAVDAVAVDAVAVDAIAVDAVSVLSSNRFTSEQSSSFVLTESEDIGTSDAQLNNRLLAEQTEVCLVYTGQLEILLRAKCQTALCDSAVDEVKWRRYGSCFVARMECLNGHCNTWSTQPPVVTDADCPTDTMFRGNLDLTTATIAAGLSYADIQRVSEVLDMGIMSKSTFFEYQLNYVMPTVDEVFMQHLQQVDQELAAAEEEHGVLNFAADAQCDSPGYSANLCCESFMELSTGLIAAMHVVHKSETATSTSQAMEPLGFQRCMEELLAVRRRKFGAVVTDNHSSINLIMRRDYADIDHQLDKWHLGKNLKKRLLSAAKSKGCEQLLPWIRSILNHLWWSVDHCQKDSLWCEELFRGCGQHVVNCHDWHDDPTFSVVTNCEHAELSAAKVSSTGWLARDSDAARKLFAILNDKRLLKGVGRIAHNLTTSALESYHSVRLIYATKRKAFRYGGYRMRAQLGVLHHNFATSAREPVVTSTGKIDVKMAFSKAGGRWSEKIRNVRPGIEWKRALLLDVRLERLRYLHENTFRTLRFPNIPCNAAPFPRPMDSRAEDLFDLHVSHSDDSDIDQ